MEDEEKMRRTCHGRTAGTSVGRWKNAVHAGELRLLPSVEKKLPRQDIVPTTSQKKVHRMDDKIRQGSRRHGRRVVRTHGKVGTSATRGRVLACEFVVGDTDGLACLTNRVEVQGRGLKRIASDMDKLPRAKSSGLREMEVAEKHP